MSKPFFSPQDPPTCNYPSTTLVSPTGSHQGLASFLLIPYREPTATKSSFHPFSLFLLFTSFHPLHKQKNKRITLPQSFFASASWDYFIITDPNPFEPSSLALPAILLV